MKLAQKPTFGTSSKFSMLTYKFNPLNRFQHKFHGRTSGSAYNWVQQ